MDVKLQELESAIGKKFNGEERTNKEKNVWYILDGMKVLRVTFPKGRGSISPGTLSSIKNQMHLSINQLHEFIKCPLEADDYESIIRGKGLVKKQKKKD
jgi:hypothetical protein